MLVHQRVDFCGFPGILLAADSPTKDPRWSQGSGQDPPAQQPNRCHFHISSYGWELNCQSKSSLSCSFAAATTSHPKSLQDSNQHSDQTRPKQKLVSILFYMFLSCSICFNSASSCKSQHITCTLPGGNRGSTVSSSTSKSCKAEGILIKSTRARMASERRPGWPLGWPLGWLWDGGQHLEAWGRLEGWGASD